LTGLAPDKRVRRPTREGPTRMARGKRNLQAGASLSRAVARCEATSLVGKLAVETLVSPHTKEVTMAQSTAPAPPAPFVSTPHQLARREGLPFLTILSRPPLPPPCPPPP